MNISLKRTSRFLIALLLFTGLAAFLPAQIFTVDQLLGTFFLDQSVTARTTDGPLDTDMFSTMAFPTTGSPPWDLHTYSSIPARSDFANNRARALSCHSSRICGIGNDSLIIAWDHFIRTYNNSECDLPLTRYDVKSDNDFSISVPVRPTGLPIGTPVTVYWRVVVGAMGLNKQEGDCNAGCPGPLVDDAFSASSGLNLQPVASNPLNLFSSTASAAFRNRLPAFTGSFNMTIGPSNRIFVTIASDLMSDLDPCGKAYNRFGDPWEVDRAGAWYGGLIEFRFTPFPFYETGASDTCHMDQWAGDNTLWGDDNGTHGQIEFSVDIGSDRELSDPVPSNNECFDPGDSYVAGGPALTPGGQNGHRNDKSIFAHDPHPTPQNLSTAAPVGVNLPIPSVVDEYFDLDGMDALAGSIAGRLTANPNPATTPSIEMFSDTCIHPARYLFLSYDDDIAQHYTYKPANGGGVPVNSGSAFLGETYGKSANDDEVVGKEALPFFGGSPLFNEYGLYDEFALHKSLSSNPDFQETFDDDVDALDITYGTEDGLPGFSCGYWYISADHEAVYHDGNGQPLDFSSIYEVDATTQTATEVIRADAHLGIPIIYNNDESLVSKPDIDAFEFVWMVDPAAGRYALALLFSVDDDDPMTLNDETGGLDPNMLYGSFLNGDYFEFSDGIPEEEDIDAITAWRSALTGEKREKLEPKDDDDDNYNNGKMGFSGEAGSGLEVYPVPATDFVTIAFPVKTSAWFAVYDAQGKQLAQGEMKHAWHALDISDYPAGNYFVRVTDENGVYSRKFVKR